MPEAHDLNRLEELFHAAIKLDPAERADFLDRLRASDPAIGNEVQSLIEAAQKAGTFIEPPGSEIAEDVIGHSEPAMRAGELLGRYRIVGQLGRGGMGEVYLAADSSLDRNVALKLLPRRFTDDTDRLRRFIFEAKAASALNHPNIITIHDIGESDGTHFIATEFIDGHTLRHRLKQNAMNLVDVLDVAIQTASALEAAHNAGIIHRDIKPENIMLRPDGYVKILDFGLAKLTETRRGEADSAAQSAIKTHLRTEPGTLLGTVDYMSPEQARGLDVDRRTDIFSLGAVMYEMAAGRRPFGGETPTDIIVSIVSHEPKALRVSVAGVPDEFQRIVSKALHKNAEGRYPTAKDLLLDLKHLKDELVFEEKLERSNPHERDQPLIQTADSTEKMTLKMIARVTDAEPEMRRTPVRRGRVLAVTVAGATLVAAALVAAILWPRPAGMPAISAPVVREHSLSYWIFVQKYRDGKPYQKPFRLAEEINFEKDYQIRLNFSSSQSGYLYLVNEGASKAGTAPSFVMIFPFENGSAHRTENQPTQIPENDWLQFDEQQGEEKLWLVWANQQVPEMEAARRFVNSKDQGLMKSPEIVTSVNEFLKSHSSPSPLIETDKQKQETIVRSNSDILTHAITLKHH